MGTRRPRTEYDALNDANGDLTSIDDTSSGATIDAYTGLNQVQEVTEALAGQEKKATSYTYDANSQPATVTPTSTPPTPTTCANSSRPSPSATPRPTPRRRSPPTPTPTAARHCARPRPTATPSTTPTTSAGAEDPGRKETQRHAGFHTYAYDPNGSKAQDVAEKMNADDHAVYLDSATDYTYDPADRLATSVKTGNGTGSETYVHDDNANVISRTVKGTSTTFTYDRNRLQSASTGGASASYTYDPFGRQESVTAGGQIIVYDRLRPRHRVPESWSTTGWPRREVTTTPAGARTPTSPRSWNTGTRVSRSRAGGTPSTVPVPGEEQQ